jgi:hypothetical protein
MELFVGLARIGWDFSSRPDDLNSLLVRAWQDLYKGDKGNVLWR